MALVPVVRAFQFSITVIMTALALSGCMRTAGPVAVAPQGDLDAMTYGAGPGPVVVVDNSGGGAISALRSSFARTSRPVYGPAPVGVAAPVASPQPARNRCGCFDPEAADRLGAGARPYPRRPRGRDIGQAARGLHSRSLGC